MTSEKTDSLSRHEVVSRAKWLIARKDLLKREKELTRQRDQLATERRALPWVKIDKEYIFDAPEGEVTLAELFAVFGSNWSATSMSAVLRRGPALTTIASICKVSGVATSTVPTVHSPLAAS